MELKTTIEHVGQEYVDEPIMVLPKIERPTVADHVAGAFAPMIAAPVRKPITVGHERVRLNWKKPVRDANGELVLDANGKPVLVPRNRGTDGGAH